MCGETSARLPQAFVVSDDDAVVKLIELALKNRLQVVPVASETRSHSGDRPPAGDPDIIILFLSSHLSEPLVALARANLQRELGRVPVLVISDRPFRTDASTQIYYQNFPCDSRQIAGAVGGILASVSPSGSAPPGS